MKSNAVRLAGGYFMYFAAVGIFAPFWSPYLAARGFTALEIGLLMALVAAARAVVPIGLGWLADVTHRPTRVLQGAALCAALTFAVFPLQSGLLQFAILSLLFGAFWNAVIPLYDTHTLNHLGEHSARYGRVRLWGSVGFIASSWIGGALLARNGYSLVPWLALPPMICAFLVTLTISPMRVAPGLVPVRGLRDVLRSRAVLVALVVATLVVMSSGAYYAFFSIWLEMNHYGKGTIGLLWALGVMAEVAIFAFGSTLLSRFSIRALFMAAAIGSAVRWLVVAFFASSRVLLPASQLLHCLSFAVLHFAIVLTAHREFPRGLESTGQSLFSSVAYGGGGLLGSLLAGVIWTTFSPRDAYVCAAFIVMLATICAVLGLRGTALDKAPSQSP
ncbi:PPP family 3-phenylpropionic acid transporter [Povalibacter uvarum]|uniref:PPP family 3-phenylpropionic acid transporter n=1 Tax=Povalibacter uvarum TaxID=732238 RepID=A0A841HG69_9GAMM|nr:MFS transporter [Povalibacter uvarum]MBB6091564.1 PPP family 3-phenylpropionic acid transporter [Povalibacter uvarum]